MKNTFLRDLCTHFSNTFKDGLQKKKIISVGTFIGMNNGSGTRVMDFNNVNSCTLIVPPRLWTFDPNFYCPRSIYSFPNVINHLSDIYR